MLQLPHGASIVDVVSVVLLENRERRRLVRGSVCAEPDLRDDAEEAFDAGPSACISNSSPSQARFNESTPMSQFYDLFYEVSRKHHSCTWGFDDLICDLRCSDIVFVIFVVKSITLAFEDIECRRCDNRLKRLAPSIGVLAVLRL
jgi:hypothetical protein